MPRGLSTEIKAAIAAATVRPVYLAFFDFAGGAVRTWTGPGDITYDSQTWNSNGVVTRWPDVAENVNLVAANITVELSGNFTYAVDLADPAIYRARACEVYIGFLDTDGTLPAANVYRVFSGRMAEVGFIEDAQADAYSVVVESRLVDLQKAKSARYTHQTQLQRFTGDTGLQYAGAAQDSLFLSRGETSDKPFSRKIVYGNTLVEGSPVFVATSGSASRYLNLCVAFADHECDAIEQVYLDDRPLLTGGVVSGEFVGIVNYYERLGSDTQDYISELEAEVTTAVWNSAFQLKGICYCYLRILYSEDLFGSDAPSISARIRGKLLYDPRTAITAYTDNAALAIRDYLLNERYGFSSGAAEVDDDSVSVAANDCDFLVDRADLTTEKRYTINGWIDTANTIGDNLRNLLSAMAGRISYIGGVFAMYAGSYSLTSLTVSDADLLSSIDFKNRNLRDSYNGARGLYRTPDLDWQEEDYPSYQNSAAATADGEERWIDLPLPYTTSAARCQRIAKIAVMRSRAARMINISTNLSLLEIRAGDVIAISTAKSQLGAEVYEVLAVIVTMGQMPRVDLELLEVAASDYAWDETTEELELTVPEEPEDSILTWTLARLATPSATPGSQTYTISFNVTVTHNEAAVICRYTLDGSEPDAGDSSVANGGTVSISGATVSLKLKTFQISGSLSSNVATYQYTYNPPTNLVPTPIYRWTWFDSAADIADNYPRLRYAVPTLSATNLRNSRNGGSSWTTLNASTTPGQYYTDTTEILSTWTPSNYRAYATREGYIDSNQIIIPNRCIPPYVFSQDNGFGYHKVGCQAFGSNCTIWRRSATKSKSSGSWSGWSSYSSAAGLGWGGYIGTQFPNLNFETEFTHYKYEFYVTQSGFTDSEVIFVQSDGLVWRYGGESGESLGFIDNKPETYS
jgi:hypothetical protein